MQHAMFILMQEVISELLSLLVNMMDLSMQWASRKTIKLTALSSAEAEYVALCEACRDAMWLRRLLSDIGFPQNKPTLIWQDNKSTIDFVRGHRQHQASKHINPKFHYSGEMVAKGEICIEHISTKLMITDILTKALPSYDHDRLGGNRLLNTDNNTYWWAWRNATRNIMLFLDIEVDHSLWFCFYSKYHLPFYNGD